MRIALISDIHGNDVAFAEVAADIARIGVDAIVCLGDVAQGGPQPRETLRRLRSLAGPVVMGNSDHFLLEVREDSPEPLTERLLEVREWSLSQLDAEDIAFIRGFSATVDVPVGSGGRLFGFHGSPRSYDDVLLPWSDGDALAPFRGTGADLLAGGHTHMQWTRRIDGALYCNPGSVGLSYDHPRQGDEDEELSVRASGEYALLTADESGSAVEFRSVPYSIADLAEAARASGHPHAEAYVSQWRS